MMRHFHSKLQRILKFVCHMYIELSLSRSLDTKKMVSRNHSQRLSPHRPSPLAPQRSCSLRCQRALSDYVSVEPGDSTSPEPWDGSFREPPFWWLVPVRKFFTSDGVSIGWNMGLSWVIGVPSVLIHLSRICPYKPSSYWGTPHFRKPPYDEMRINRRNP